MTFRETIKNLRIERGYSQTTLANLLNISRSTESDWETGRSEPSLQDLLNVSELFDISIDYLIGNTDEWGNAKESRALQKAPAITEGERELLDLYNAVSSERKREAIVWLKTMKELDRKAAKTIPQKPPKLG